MEEYLALSRLHSTPRGNAVLLDCLLCIIRNLWYKHMRFRDCFLGSLEQSCASANNFYRMMETLEQLLIKLRSNHPVLRPNSKGHFENAASSVLHQEATHLLSLYSSDAVFVAQRAHIFVIREIQLSNIPAELFSRNWEDRYVHNEVAVSLVKAVEEYVYELHNYLCNDLLYRKTMDAVVKSIVCLYIRCLVQRADEARRGRNRGLTRSFSNPSRAVCRMMYDIQVFRDYFYQLVKFCPSLARAVDCELDVLTIVHECLGMAARSNTSTSSLEEYVVVLHKRSGGSYNVTRHLMGDLWYLAAPSKHRHEIYNTVVLMRAELQVLSTQLSERSALDTSTGRDALQGLRLATALQQRYEERTLQERSSICAPCLRVAADLASNTNNNEHKKLVP